MTYTVAWTENAQSDLLRLWLESTNRALITRTADAIDPTLRIDPVLRGETYTASTRLLTIPPLLVLYRVVEEDRMVRILSIQPVPASSADE
jgi:plasmid stabilization system protein ParE